MNTKKTLRLLGAALCGGSAFCLLYYNLLELLLLGVLPLLLALAGMLAGVPGLVAAAVAFLALGVWALGATLLPFLALFLLGGVGAYLSLARAKRAFHALLGCCATALAALWAFLYCYSSIFGSAALGELLTPAPQALQAVSDAYLALGAAPDVAAAMVAELSAMVAEQLPGLLLLSMVLTGLVAYGLGTVFLKKTLPYTPPAFAQWRLPKGYLLGGSLMLLLFFLAEAAGMADMVSATYAARTLVLFLYAMQGLCVLWFLLARTRLVGALRVLCCALAALLPTVPILLTLTDEFLQLRRRLPPKSGRPPNPFA